MKEAERLERLAEMIEQNQVDNAEVLREVALVMSRMHLNQKKELESIRFNTGWCLYVLIAILVSVSTGWFWE